MFFWGLSSSFVWDIFLCHLILSVCDCGFRSTGCRIVVLLASAVCPLVDEAGRRGLCRLPGGRDWFLPTGVWSWVLSLWWAGPRQGVCLAGSCGLRKNSGSLFADGWGCVSALLVVWPETSQHWSLQDVAWGQVLVRKWRPPGGLTPSSTLQNYCHQCFCPHSEPQLPPTSAGNPPIPAGDSGPGSYEVIAFPPGSQCTQNSKSGVSVSPSPVEFL